MAPEARTYLATALDIMEKNALVRDDVDWPALRRKAFATAKRARTSGQTYEAVDAALMSLGDRHSRFIAPGDAKRNAEAPLDSSGTSRGRILPGGIGYLSLPAIHSLRAAPEYIRQGRAVVGSVDRAGADRWIIDLRDNHGGNMWAPLAVVGAILGDGDVGAFVAADGTRQPWTIRNGTPPQYANSPGPAEPLSHPRPAVAVLTGGVTASAAEAVAIAFRGRPTTRGFGEPTAGLPTGNVAHTLSDGAELVLTEAREADRTGRLYDGAIPPDEEAPEGPSDRGPDRGVEAATRWLAAQRASGS